MKSLLAALAATTVIAAPAFAYDCGSKARTASTATDASTAGFEIMTVGHHKEMKPNIVETADAAGSFTTLLTAATAADLATPLAEDGPFTVFAPTDAAFAKLPEGTVASLLEPENIHTLTDILTYHVVAGEVFAADLDGKVLSVETLAGETLIIDGREGVRINGVAVETADIKAENGVIHVIGSVLLPPQPVN